MKKRIEKSAGAPLTSEEFFDILRHRTSRTARRLDKALLAGSGRKLTVLMADSSGFTKKTHQFGILHFLATMTRAYDRLIPILEASEGICISHNADNILGIFEKPDAAVKAAIAMNRHLKRHNRSLAPKDRFNICIGINTGDVIRLADNVYGDPVNIAAKIGEDLAGKDEILVTRVVHEALGNRFKSQYDRATEIGGRIIELFQIDY